MKSLSTKKLSQLDHTTRMIDSVCMKVRFKLWHYVNVKYRIKSCSEDS